MTRKELMEMHIELCDVAFRLMSKKNADYANGDNPFLNFRASQNYNVHPAKGILIRMSDKMSRINSYIERGDFKVEEEGLRDTAIDIINYTVLLVGLLEESTFPKEGINPDYPNKLGYSNDLKGTHECEDVLTEEGIKTYELRLNTNGSAWAKEKDCTCRIKNILTHEHNCPIVNKKEDGK